MYVFPPSPGSSPALSSTGGSDPAFPSSAQLPPPALALDEPEDNNNNNDRNNDRNDTSRSPSSSSYQAFNFPRNLERVLRAQELEFLADGEWQRGGLFAELLDLAVGQGLGFRGRAAPVVLTAAGHVLVLVTGPAAGRAWSDERCREFVDVAEDILRSHGLFECQVYVLEITHVFGSWEE